LENPVSNIDFTIDERQDEQQDAEVLEDGMYDKHGATPTKELLFGEQFTRDTPGSKSGVELISCGPTVKYQPSLKARLMDKP
jgi:hypothetical protein